MLQKDKLNIIKAPTGSGKTYFALTGLAASVPDATHKIVYLIDTINGKEQILQNYNARPLYHLWQHELDGICFEDDTFETDNRIVIMTYAKFGVLLDREPNFHQHFDYIICDELHSLVRFQYFSPQPNYSSVAKRGLERAVRNDRTAVIALSATPAQIQDNFDCPQFLLPIDDNEIIHYETKEVIRYTNLDTVLSTLNPAETGLCYVSHITPMKKIAEKARALGLSPVCVWSINNEKHEMTQEQMKVRESVLKDYILPAEYNFFIINSSSETSLKIKSPMDYAIVHSGDNATQIQVRGRINSDLPRIYLPTNDPSVVCVPDAFLIRPLFADDKRKLCEVLNLRNKQGRLCGWPTVKRSILNCGYNIYEGRKNSKHYAVISIPVEE